MLVCKHDSDFDFYISPVIIGIPVERKGLIFWCPFCNIYHSNTNDLESVPDTPELIQRYVVYDLESRPYRTNTTGRLRRWNIFRKAEDIPLFKETIEE